MINFNMKVKYKSRWTCAIFNHFRTSINKSKYYLQASFLPENLNSAINGITVWIQLLKIKLKWANTIECAGQHWRSIAPLIKSTYHDTCFHCRLNHPRGCTLPILLLLLGYLKIKQIFVDCYYIQIYTIPVYTNIAGDWQGCCKDLMKYLYSLLNNIVTEKI